MQISSLDYVFREVRADTPEDTAVASLLRPYREQIGAQMQEVITYCAVPLTKARPESALGNLVADAQHAAAAGAGYRVDAAVANYGGIRINYVDPGPVTRERIYELLPFDNTLTIVEVTGAALQLFCDTMAARGGWPVSRLSYTIRNGRAEQVQVGGVPLQPHQVYALAVNDYMANGGDGLDWMRSLPRTNTALLIRDALIGYLKTAWEAGDTLAPVPGNRIRYAE